MILQPILHTLRKPVKTNFLLLCKLQLKLAPQKKNINKTKNIKNFGIAGQQKARKEGKNDSIKEFSIQPPCIYLNIKDM